MALKKKAVVVVYVKKEAFMVAFILNVFQKSA